MEKKKIDFDYKNFAAIAKIALTFPGTTEEVSHYNTPSVKVNGKFMTRLHESGEFIPIHLDFDLREIWLEKYPDLLHVPDHYKNYPYLCMRVHSYDNKMLTELLTESWKGLAKKKQLEEWLKKK